MIFWESGPWERFHALCGFEESLVALYEEPEAVHELMQAITDFKIAMVAKIKEYYNPDIICVLDDFGHQKGPFSLTTLRSAKRSQTPVFFTAIIAAAVSPP